MRTFKLNNELFWYATTFKIKIQTSIKEHKIHNLCNIELINQKCIEKIIRAMISMTYVTMNTKLVLTHLFIAYAMYIF